MSDPKNAIKKKLVGIKRELQAICCEVAKGCCPLAEELEIVPSFPWRVHLCKLLSRCLPQPSGSHGRGLGRSQEVGLQLSLLPDQGAERIPAQEKQSLHPSSKSPVHLDPSPPSIPGDFGLPKGLLIP